MHFADNWDEDKGEVWGDIFINESPIHIAYHHCKFTIVEDAFNAQWKAAVIFGWWLTMDKSHMPGWYNGPTTQRPEPKLVRTGATMHTM